MAMLVHVPTTPAITHDWQFPLHWALQQTPSVQTPLWHSVPSAQGVPLPKRLPHAPVPLQLTAPAHSFAGSVPKGMLVQVPCAPIALHTWHVPAQALLQQYPSTQLPIRHSPDTEQGCPTGSLQAPAPSVPSHTLAPGQSVSLLSVPAIEMPQSPLRPVPLSRFVHAPHTVEQAELQHTPSTQKAPEGQSATPAHVLPRQLPPASQMRFVRHTEPTPTGGNTGVPPEHWSTVQSFASFGRSLLSWFGLMPPAPSHT